ncbi:hypothetical protein [Streptomyces sp. NPDC096153]|uniref:hypothetical protein n=1 Tax=Streptomyces sp. NPDC096153 TaxID=3155548 RepID=UPI003326AB86
MRVGVDGPDAVVRPAGIGEILLGRQDEGRARSRPGSAQHRNGHEPYDALVVTVGNGAPQETHLSAVAHPRGLLGAFPDGGFVVAGARTRRTARPGEQVVRPDGGPLGRRHVVSRDARVYVRGEPYAEWYVLVAGGRPGVLTGGHGGRVAGAAIRPQNHPAS